MKKQNIINLIRYHMDRDDSAFRNEVADIARDFEKNGEYELSDYLMELISTTYYFKPQNSYRDLNYLKKIHIENKSLLLPDCIQEDLLGLVKSVSKRNGISKVLFYGAPGTGKTESVYQIGRLLNRDVLSVRMEELIDSHLGQTSKNIVELFNEINRLPSTNVVILFDELDSIVMDRINKSDLREMGRVTSTFLREMESLSSDILMIGTTNLIESFDKALLRRFDATISFDRYSRDDLIEISVAILANFLRKSEISKMDTRLFKKILSNLQKIPYPGDMTQIIKVAVAFSDDSNEYDYLRRIYLELNNGEKPDYLKLIQEGYTTREVEILTRISKSSVSRKIREDNRYE